MKLIDMALPYKVTGASGLSADQVITVNRDITSALIQDAMNQMYPNGMTKKEARIFQGIMNQIASGDHVLSLDDKQIEALQDIFLSDKAEKTLRCRPVAAGWILQWSEYLDKIRLGAQDDADEPRRPASTQP